MSENSAKDIEGGQGKDGTGLKLLGEFCKIIFDAICPPARTLNQLHLGGELSSLRRISAQINRKYFKNFGEQGGLKVH